MGRHTFSMGINEYSDLVRYISLKYEADFELFTHFFSKLMFLYLLICQTWAEYRKYLLGAKRPAVRKYNSSGVYKRTLKDLPQSVDWRTKDYVTPIKNQVLKMTKCKLCCLIFLMAQMSDHTKGCKK